MTTTGFFAALVPILGSLYVAFSFLAEQGRLHHERRVRYRVSALVERRREVAKAIHMPAGSRWTPALRAAVDAEVAAFSEQMLRYNGVRPTRPIIRDLNVAVAMSAPALHSSELRRQWTLLVSATVGLVLLVIEASA